LTRDIVQNFEDNDAFTVQYYGKSPDAIQKLMTEGKIYFGLIIPEGFTQDLKQMKSPVIETMIDGSQLSTASFTKIAASEILLSTKYGVMMKALQGKYNMSEEMALNTARPLAFTTRLLGNPTRNYVNFLMPGLMLALVQVGMVMNATSAFNQRERKQFLKSGAQYALLYTAMGFVSLLSLLMVQHLFFEVPLMGNLFELCLLTLAFSMAVTGQSLLIAAALNSKVLAAQVGAVWFFPSSILSGYTWPLISMPQMMQFLAALMPFTYFGDTVRDLLLKGEASLLWQNSVTLILMGLISMAAAVALNTVRLFLQEKGVLKFEMES